MQHLYSFALFAVIWCSMCWSCWKPVFFPHMRDFYFSLKSLSHFHVRVKVQQWIKILWQVRLFAWGASTLNEISIKPHTHTAQIKQSISLLKLYTLYVHVNICTEFILIGYVISYSFFMCRWTLNVGWLESLCSSRSSHSYWLKRPVADWVMILFVFHHCLGNNTFMWQLIYNFTFSYKRQRQDSRIFHLTSSRS